MLAQLVWPSEFYFSSSFSSFRDAGGDRIASHSHRSDWCVACVVDEDGSDHGAVQNYNIVWIRIPVQKLCIHSAYMYRHSFNSVTHQILSFLFFLST